MNGNAQVLGRVKSRALGMGTVVFYNHRHLILEYFPAFLISCFFYCIKKDYLGTLLQSDLVGEQIDTSAVFLYKNIPIAVIYVLIMIESRFKYILLSC